MILPLLCIYVLTPLQTATAPASPDQEAPVSENAESIPTEAGVSAVLKQARAYEADLEYDDAAALLTEIIVDEETPIEILTEARTRLAAVEIIRGFNAEARLHYEWLLNRDQDFAASQDAPPKVRGFFMLVREDWLANKKSQQALLQKEGGGSAATTGEESAKGTGPHASPNEDPSANGDEGGSAAPKLPAPKLPAPKLPAPDVSPDYLSAGLAAYGVAAIGTTFFCAPTLLVVVGATALTLPALGVCGCVVGGVTPIVQAISLVFLGGLRGPKKSNAVYATTLLASFASFLAGGLVVIGSAIAFAALTPLLGLSNDLAFTGGIVVAGVVSLIFVALQPAVPLLAFWLQPAEAATDASLNEGEALHSPSAARASQMSAGARKIRRPHSQSIAMQF